MRATGKYTAYTSRMLAMMREVSTDHTHTPSTLAAHLGVSTPTIYRMLNDLCEAYGAASEWGGSAYTVRRWGVLSRKKIINQTVK